MKHLLYLLFFCACCSNALAQNVEISGGASLNHYYNLPGESKNGNIDNHDGFGTAFCVSIEDYKRANFPFRATLKSVKAGKCSMKNG